MEQTLSPELWLAERLQTPPEELLSDLEVETFWVRAMKSIVPSEQLDEVLGIPRANSLLFYGPAGTGRHTLANALAGSLGRKGYKLLSLYGEDFDADISERVKEIARCVSTGMAMTVILEELEHCENTRELSFCLAQLAKLSARRDYPLVLVVIAGEKPELPERLLRELQPCRFDLPTRDERTAFYAAVVQGVIPIREGLTARDLANIIQDMTMSQLLQTVRLAQLALKLQALEQFRGNTDKAANAVEGRKVSVDLVLMRAIADRVRQPKQEAPAPAPVVQYVPAAAPAPAQPDTNPAAPKSEKIKQLETEEDRISSLESMNIEDFLSALTAGK